MPYPLPLTRTEAYLAYKAGVIQQSDLKPSLAIPRNGIDAWLAYWTGLAADYPKREDGTPHILQEEEAYIAYLCGVINEYPEKCLRRVGAYLRYLISARWGRPDHPLNREELYLSLIKTQVIPSGDPSSDIEIDGTAKAAFVDIKMYGGTFQQTYSGKNLFNRENYGTLVGWASGGEIKNYGNRVFYIQCKPETTYTIQKMLAIPVERSRCQIFTTADAPAVGVAVIGVLFSTNDATQATVTTQSGANYLCVACYETLASTETTVQEMADSIMIEEGATASHYEPYVGGLPSPNPDYPQMVQTVTGLQKVNVRGKNLFSMFANILKAVAAGEATLAVANGTLDSITDNSIETSAISNDSFLTVNGYHGINPNFEYKIPISPSTDYTFSYSATGWTQFIMRTFDENNTQLQEFSNLNTGNPAGDYSRAFTSHANAKWLGIRLDNESYRHGETKAKFYNIQLEEGSPKTSYEPYSSNDYYINLGKNLFDKDNAIIYALNPTTSGQALSPLTNACSTFIPITAGDTFTVSTTNRALLDTYASVYFISGTPDTATTWITRTSFGQNSSVTVTAPAGATYLGMYFLYSNNQATIANAEATIQIEMGSTATPYAPYFKPIELCKLGDYQDCIYKDSDTWKVHKAIGAYTFDGSQDENWFKSGATTTSVFIGAISIQQFGIYIPTDGRAAYSLSNNFNYDSADSRYVGGFRLYNQYGGYVSNLRLDIPGTADTTIDDFKSWLSTHNTIVYYAKATATDTIITNQPLIAQLEALVAGGAENGTTYIKVNATDPNLPGLLVVEAPKYE